MNESTVPLNSLITYLQQCLFFFFFQSSFSLHLCQVPSHIISLLFFWIIKLLFCHSLQGSLLRRLFSRPGVFLTRLTSFSVTSPIVLLERPCDPAWPALQWVPWTIVVPQDDGSVKIRGPMGHVLDLLSKHLQFEYVSMSH